MILKFGVHKKESKEVWAFLLESIERIYPESLCKMLVEHASFSDQVQVLYGVLASSLERHMPEVSTFFGLTNLSIGV